MSNTRIWNALGKTDPKHTKKFSRPGGFKGDAIKPMWAYRRMTEYFGPCGIGWGVNEPTFQVVHGHNSEVMVYCTVSAWYVEGDNSSPNNVFGVGGDKVVTHIKENKQYNKPERWENDDEAFKKAYTDALTNALKLIGVGADVHMGMFDDNKYVNSLQVEFSEEAKTPVQEPKQSQPKTNRLSKDKSRDLYERMQKDLEDCANEGPDTISSLMQSNEMLADLASLPEDWEKKIREDARALYKTTKEFFDGKKSEGVDAKEYIAKNFPGAGELKGNG